MRSSERGGGRADAAGRVGWKKKGGRQREKRFLPKINSLQEMRKKKKSANIKEKLSRTSCDRFSNKKVRQSVGKSERLLLKQMAEGLEGKDKESK